MAASVHFRHGHSRQHLGGDVLKNDFQRSQALAQRFHHAFYKARFTIKNVDICMCHFTMHQ
ncbi:Uncharacterised protein [Escherichia coli]|uniref:Uncharacterized protein n=1 Tax=Escherichia coli TaxID=562 RepID=A0A377E675_ECOLX|nr:Uncharacterised protein [Escherichia coli]